ncbi:MAG: 2OG-Fe(II) oxygenase [Myxococcales bacterium]|nr:2OG-Fe(II) oxygenase [Myxococcales bacterium]
MYVEREDLYPTPTRVAAAPALWVVDEFLGEREIEALLELFGDEGFVQDHADHYGWDGSGFAAEVAADQHPTLAAVMERIEAALGCTSSLTPTLRFRYYPEEHGHPPHVDAYTEGEHRLAITALITLVAADEGGETRFVDALPEPVAVAPRRGRMVAWTSTLAGGADDPASRHDGAPVLRGAKGVLLAFLYLPPTEHRGDLDLAPRSAA